MLTWENEFLSDDWELKDNDVTVATVKPLGASWEVTYKGRIVAIRPDLDSARSVASKLHGGEL